MWEFRDDDLTGDLTRAFVADHLAQMHAQSPAESVHALDVDALRSPEITLVTAWGDDEVCGMGAYRRMPEHAAEVKSMRVAEAARGLGLGRLLLRQLIERADAEGITGLWLETGSSADFRTARGLYLSEGFVPCPPFGPYREDPESLYFRRDI